MSKKRCDGLETRGRLLDAAAVIFAAGGFHDSKVADICRKAGANVAAVNYYFGGKEKLYAEAWRYAFERSMAAYPPDGGIPASAPAEKRLYGQIFALVRRIMDPNSLDFDIGHKEMANPTGLLSEVMRRSIEPLRWSSMAIVRELLGPQATEQQVQLCEMSIHSQCFGPLMHERHRRQFPDKRKVLGPFPKAITYTVMADHVFRFSLAGISEMRTHSKSSKLTRTAKP